MTIEYSNDVDFDWLYEYCKFCFERALKIHSTLDEKADGIIKYLGGGTGLVTIAAISNARAENSYLYACLIPSVFFAILSILVACSARLPRTISDMPPVEAAYQLAKMKGEGDQRVGKAYFIAAWHQNVEHIHAVCKTKARLVSWSHWLFGLSIFFLPVPLIMAAYVGNMSLSHH